MSNDFRVARIFELESRTTFRGGESRVPSAGRPVAHRTSSISRRGRLFAGEKDRCRPPNQLLQPARPRFRGADGFRQSRNPSAGRRRSGSPRATLSSAAERLFPPAQGLRSPAKRRLDVHQPLRGIADVLSGVHERFEISRTPCATAASLSSCGRRRVPPGTRFRPRGRNRVSPVPRLRPPGRIQGSTGPGSRPGGRIEGPAGTPSRPGGRNLVSPVTTPRPGGRSIVTAGTGSRPGGRQRVKAGPCPCPFSGILEQGHGRGDQPPSGLPSNSSRRSFKFSVPILVEG